jgi:hypothetical protein
MGMVNAERATAMTESRPRGAGLPSAITRTDTAPDGSASTRQPSAKAIALMTASEFKAAIGKGHVRPLLREELRPGETRAVRLHPFSVPPAKP